MEYQVSELADNVRSNHSSHTTSELALVEVQGIVDSHQLEGYVVRRLQAVLDGPNGEVVTVEGELVNL